MSECKSLRAAEIKTQLKRFVKTVKPGTKSQLCARLRYHRNKQGSRKSKKSTKKSSKKKSTSPAKEKTAKPKRLVTRQTKIRVFLAPASTLPLTEQIFSHEFTISEVARRLRNHRTLLRKYTFLTTAGTKDADIVILPESKNKVGKKGLRKFILDNNDQAKFLTLREFFQETGVGPILGPTRSK